MALAAPSAPIMAMAAPPPPTMVMAAPALPDIPSLALVAPAQSVTPHHDTGRIGLAGHSASLDGLPTQVCPMPRRSLLALTVPSALITTTCMLPQSRSAGDRL